MVDSGTGIAHEVAAAAEVAPGVFEKEGHTHILGVEKRHGFHWNNGLVAAAVAWPPGAADT